MADSAPSPSYTASPPSSMPAAADPPSSRPDQPQFGTTSNPVASSDSHGTGGYGASSDKPQKLISCIQCQQRKVKCNKVHPCSHCVKSRLECIYRPPAPPRRGKRKPTEADLLARLRRCEELLKGAGVEVDGEGNVAGLDGEGLGSGAGEGSEKGEGGARLPGLASLVGKTDSYAQALVDAYSGEVAKQTAGDAPMMGRSDATRNGEDGGRMEGVEQGPALGRDRGGMVAQEDGRENYVESSLWREIGQRDPGGSKRVADVNDDVQRSWNEAQGQGRPFVQLPGDGAFIFDTPIGRADLSELHPSQEDVMVLWKAFQENIDPLAKIMHVPTLEPEIWAASKDPRGIPDNLEAIMFAVYASAVLSMSATECEEAIGISRSILATRFETGAKKALINAGLLKSSDFRLLQAFVLWLLSVRQSYDPRSLWTLTGVALRLGQRLGLHREKALKTLPVFEAEMRRRLWWQIMILDNRAAELSGSGVSIFVNLFDTKTPRNLNDRDLYPEMSELPPERSGATDMIFLALRYELGTFLRRTMPTSAGSQTFMATKDEDIDRFEQLLESKILRFCDALYPLHFLTSIVGRAALATIRLITHHPSQYPDGGASMSSEEKHMLFELSLKLVKYDQLIRATKVLHKYIWHIEAYFPWHAFIYILSHLSNKEAKKEDSVTAWEQIHHVFENYPQIVTDIKKPLNVAIGNLTLKAWDVDGEQNSNLWRRGSSSTPGQSPSTPQSQGQNPNQRNPPYFISVLRAQRASRNAGISPAPSTPGPLNSNLNSMQPPSRPYSGSTPSSSASLPAPSTAQPSESHAISGGFGSGAFFPFLPPPTAFQTHIRKHNIPQPPSMPLPPYVPQVPLSVPPDSTLSSSAATASSLTYVSDPMAIESMAMGLDMGSVDWADWDRLLAQDMDSMIPGPGATGFGVGVDEVGGMWENGG